MKRILVTFTVLTLLVLPDSFVSRATAQTSEIVRGEKEMLKKAKTVVIACRLYAMDHAGRFPTTLAELLPEYLPHKSTLKCSLSPDDPIGYHYFGGAEDGPRQISLYSKAALSTGEWIVVYSDAKAEFTTDKPKPQN